MDSNFVIVTYPSGKDSMLRSGILRECDDGEIGCCCFVRDASFWNLDLEGQVLYIQSRMIEGKRNFIIFIPAVGIPNYVPPKLVEKVKRDLDAVAVVVYHIDSMTCCAKGRKMSVEKFNHYFDAFDMIYSYNLYEAKEYGYRHVMLPLKKFDIKDRTNGQAKVFFCGREKGRLGLLKDIAARLEENGIAYEFYLLRNKSNEGMEDTGGIRFISYAPYDWVVDKISEASCLLSLAAYDARMVTAAYNEAVMYNKLLLTNCDFLPEIPYYDGRYMKTFREASEIDCGWLSGTKEVDYGYQDAFSPSFLFRKLEEDFDSGLLRRCAEHNTRFQRRSAGAVRFSYHFGYIGWIYDIENGQPVVKKQQLEAVMIENPHEDLRLQMQVRQRKIGWQICEVGGGSCVCGTTGKCLPVTAFRLAVIVGTEKYQVIYRAYMKISGWTRFYRDGEVCGSRDETCEDMIMGLQILCINDGMDEGGVLR